ncbi:MAG: rRNA maturation RNase YbeY [Methyloceanibacter sp.]
MVDPGPSSPDQGRGGASRPPRLDVEIVRQAELWDRIPVSDTRLSQAAMAAFMAIAPTGQGPYEATLVLADDQAMRTLNRTWRGKDAPTNVLSFPAGETVGEVFPCPLGDVVLAGETVLHEAALQGVAAADHVSHLVVHGMLHLLGHDHARDDEAERMEALETEVLLGLGIADPYAEARPADVAEVSP